MMKFYKCKACGNIVTYIEDKGTPLSCCGQQMVELIPGETDAAVEKHVPVVLVEGDHVIVKVGEVSHPMTAEHLIQWIVLETNQGSRIKYLDETMEPQAAFVLGVNEIPLAVYEYCNLHGLWKKTI